MVSEDAAANDSLLLGVAYGPSMTRFLIAIVPNTSSGEVICHAFTDDAIALGAFDKFANAESSNGGKSYGSTIDEVFKYYVGHAPGANH